MCHKRGHSGDASDDTLSIVLTPRVAPGPRAGHIVSAGWRSFSSQLESQCPGYQQS